MYVKIKKYLSMWLDAMMWRYAYDRRMVLVWKLLAFFIILSPKYWLEFCIMKSDDLRKKYILRISRNGKLIMENKLKEKYKNDILFRIFL